ncbi:hypothetical protein REPUB_Repub10bG0067800 [Reevesia pubescens]
MSNPGVASNNDGNKQSGDSKDAAVAKTAGFVVFSGIALSILKTLNPFNKDRNATPLPQQPVAEWTQSSPIQPIRDSPSAPSPEPIITEKASNNTEQRVAEHSERVIKIVKGDTLWGLSRKYGVLPFWIFIFA